MTERVKKPRVEFEPDSNDVDPSDRGEYLWHADPECLHEVYARMAGGVRCRCCRGWYCL